MGAEEAHAVTLEFLHREARFQHQAEVTADAISGRTGAAENGGAKIPHVSGREVRCRHHIGHLTGPAF